MVEAKMPLMSNPSMPLGIVLSAMAK